MQFPSRIRLFSALVILEKRTFFLSLFLSFARIGRIFKKFGTRIKIPKRKSERRGKECVESGETRNRTLLLNIEKRNIYIYIYNGATFLGRDWEEFLSLFFCLCLGTVFSYADLGRARERKRERACLSAICKWRRIAVSGRFDNGPDNYARYNGLAFTPRVRSIVKVSWPMNRGENSVAPYRRRHDIFNCRDTFLSALDRPSVGRSTIHV